MQIPKFNPQAERIGSIIRIGRTRKNLSQKDVGKAIRVSDTMLCRYERGVSTPNIVLYQRMSKLLDLDQVEREVFISHYKEQV
jgi:ribosome-binding protein aMBF1 (putative translation factor)